MAGNWIKSAEFMPAMNAPQFSSLLHQGSEEKKVISASSTQSTQERLATALNSDELLKTTTAIIMERISNMLGLAVEDINPSQLNNEIGIDSLMAIELKVILLLSPCYLLLTSNYLELDHQRIQYSCGHFRHWG